MISDVNLYYWTSTVSKLNVTETYKGILQMYRGDLFLGYAYFQKSMTFLV
ncbi:hypothetical protein BDD26_2421 [Xenorhabdus cabanillasii]|uniref:Uncharacterized protein n=1 Tax=Xenorhabdus cabanillasii TaxID=351673 RepID=A0A3D9UNP1_9GAMM|nr:hypothetical protein BDD26_2421 [Xenorhabdus cabanillasii]